MSQVFRKRHLKNARTLSAMALSFLNAQDYALCPIQADAALSSGAAVIFCRVPVQFSRVSVWEQGYLIAFQISM